MASVAELERDLKQARERVESKREKKQDWKRKTKHRGDRLREHIQAVEEAREERDDNRKRLVLIRDRIEEKEKDGISDEERERYGELVKNLEALVDENEELTAFIQDELPKIDKLDRKREHAADLRRKFDKEFERAIKRREKIERELREAKAENRPSPHFTYAEFDCNDGTPIPEASKPAVKEWCQRIGEPLRARYGSVHVNSGFRHAAYNRAIGGATNSVHIYDYPGRACKAVAADITCAGGSPGEWFNFTAGKADGRGRYATFHHADTRNNIGWPDAVWSG